MKRNKIFNVTESMLRTKYQEEMMRRQEQQGWNVLLIVVMAGIVLRLIFEIVNRW